MTEMKNKKMQNDVSFHFYIDVIPEKSTTYAKFEKNGEKWRKMAEIWSDFLKKLIFIDFVVQISAHIDVAT